MNRLFLVRHGENLANLTLEFSHRMVDYPLTPKGVLQAQQTAAYLVDSDIHEVYASPLKRALQTAEIIAEPLGLPVTVMENFREMDVGELEGQTPTAALWDLHNTILDRWIAGQTEVCFPGGEDCLTLQARARDGFEQILAGKDERNILVVAHGGIFNFGVLRQLRLNADEAAGLDQPMANCSITELEARLVEGRLDARLRAFAQAAHLSGEAARLVFNTQFDDEGQVKE